MPNLPITSPDTGPGQPIDVETSQKDGPKGPFFNTECLPVSHIDQATLVENAAHYREGKSVVVYYLEHAGVISAAEYVVGVDSDGKEITQNPVLDLIDKANNFYEEEFFDKFAAVSKDREGMNGDGLMDLYEKTEEFEKLPFLRFFRELTDANPNIDQIRDAERIARILVLDEAQR